MQICEQAIGVLNAASPKDKVAAAHKLTQNWCAGVLNIADNSNLTVPNTPGRPEHPELVSPQDVKRRRLGSLEGRISLLHAITHIEFNAINLAADMVARYALNTRIADKDRHAFINDWLNVLDDEAPAFHNGQHAFE